MSPPLCPPKVAGIYGISGCGKSHVLSQLARRRPEWRCVEGSDTLRSIVKRESLQWETFQADKIVANKCRSLAIDEIRAFDGLTLVAGHCSFPHDETGSSFDDVFTVADAATYDAIVYLDVDISAVASQRRQDNHNKQRVRPSLSSDTLEKWLQHEKELLRKECKVHQIPLHIVSVHGDAEKNSVTDTIEQLLVNTLVSPMVQQAQNQSERALREAVSAVVAQASRQTSVFLVIDGDRTMSIRDTSELFFDEVSGVEHGSLKQIFQRYTEYTFEAFFEVAMLYTKLFQEPDDYVQTAENVGTNRVELFHQWKEFLVNLPATVHPILVTSGIREVWIQALSQYAIPVCSSQESPRDGRGISILAGNHLRLHPYVMDSAGKGLVVAELRRLVGGCTVIAFGDSGELLDS